MNVLEAGSDVLGWIQDPDAWSCWVPATKATGDIEILEVLARQLCEPDSESWREAMESLACCCASHITDCYAISGQNAIPALMRVQDDPDAAPEDRKSAATLLGLLSHIAHSTADTDPFPECSDSQLLQALHPEDGRVGLPDGVRILRHTVGEEPQEDVVVVERLGNKELSLGVWQLDGFTETEMPCTVPEGSEGAHALLLSWINRAFGAVVRLAVSRAVQPETPRVLLLGLGGGTLAHLVLQSHPGAVVDAVELNPAVVDAAQQCFGLGVDRYNGRLTVHVSEAAEFVCKFRGEASWDLVLVDLYSADSLPELCTTTEFFEAVCSLLTTVPGEGAHGLVAFNCGRELEEFENVVSNAQAVHQQNGKAANGECAEAAPTLQVDVVYPLDGPDSVVELVALEKATADVECSSGEQENHRSEENLIDNALILFSHEAGLMAQTVAREAGEY